MKCPVAAPAMWDKVRAIGALLTFVLVVIWLRADSLGSEFWAAIAGAVVGGVITAILQFISLQAAKTQRQEDRADARRALGRALLLKVMRIYSNVLQLHNYIEQSIADGEKRGIAEPWAMVRPLANFPPKVHFNIEEMSLVLSWKDFDFFNSLLSIDEVHNSLIDVFATLSGLRHALASSLPANMSGEVGRIELPPDVALRVRPKMAELNLLIEDVRQRTNVDAREAFAILNKLRDALNSKLGFGVQLQSPLPPAPPGQAPTAKS